MIIRLEPINDSNRDAVLALSVREDQPFVAENDYSLNEAEETNNENPGTARPFAIYADGRLVGFCMFAFDPEVEDPDDRYWLWRFMIDKDEQGKGYGQAALQEIIRYFKKNGADRLFLSTSSENEMGLHIYHKAGFRETGMPPAATASGSSLISVPRPAMFVAIVTAPCCPASATISASDRKSTRLNSSHTDSSRMPSSA